MESPRPVGRWPNIFRTKADSEIPNYTNVLENNQFEHGLLTYLREGAYGELADLVKEVGIKQDTIPFMNLQELKKSRENLL